MNTEMWIMFGINSVLLGVSGYFIKMWIAGVKREAHERKRIRPK